MTFVVKKCIYIRIIINYIFLKGKGICKLITDNLNLAHSSHHQGEGQKPRGLLPGIMMAPGQYESLCLLYVIVLIPVFSFLYTEPNDVFVISTFSAVHLSYSLSSTYGIAKSIFPASIKINLRIYCYQLWSEKSGKCTRENLDYETTPLLMLRQKANLIYSR